MKAPLLSEVLYYAIGFSFAVASGWLIPNQLATTEHIYRTNQGLDALKTSPGARLELNDPAVQSVFKVEDARSRERRTKDASVVTAAFTVLLLAAGLFMKRMRIGDPLLFSSPLLLLWPFAGHTPLLALLPAVAGVGGILLRKRRNTGA